MSQNFYIPNHMSAIVTTGNGGFEKLSYKTVKTPVINKNEVLDNIQAIRDKTSLPVVLGFGLKDPSQINEFKSHADGFVIGSAIVELLNQDNPQAKLRKFLTPILTTIKNE